MEIPYQKISDALIDSLIETEDIDSVTVDGVQYTFLHPKLRIEYDRVYTGVHHYGFREYFDKKNIYVGGLICNGVYDSDGEEVDCAFDSNQLHIDYSGGTVSIHRQ